MKIFINPGHGGADPGAVGNGLAERDVVLKIGKRVEEYLRGIHEVRLYQYDGLAEICDAANYYDADLFVSIHCNAANGQARGTETYYYPGSERGWIAATKIQNQIVKAIGTVNRGVKTAGFYVIKYTDMPAVLVETAFIDNAADARLLVDYEDEFARAIARGITDYTGGMK